MNMAESLDRQARQREINRQERNALRETIIREEAVNQMSIPEEVNFMAERNDSHFNSTMKNNSGCWNNSPNRSNSYHSDRNNSYHGDRNNLYYCGTNNSLEAPLLLQRLCFSMPDRQSMIPPFRYSSLAGTLSYLYV